MVNKIILQHIYSIEVDMRYSKDSNYHFLFWNFEI